MGTIASAWWIAACFAAASGGDDSAPGWATNCVGPMSRDVAVMSVSEQAAFALAPGASLLPSVAAAGFHCGFAADLHVPRPGRYRFTLDGSGGRAFLTVVDDAGAKLGAIGTHDDVAATSDWLALKSGTVRLLVSFDRKGDAPARLRTLWEMEAQGNGVGFAAEPILPSAVTIPAEFKKECDGELSARRGRVLLTELGCANCHAADAAGLVERRPPIALAHVATRARAEWLARWIAAPQKLNPGCGMPALLGSDGRGKGDAAKDGAALVALFESLSPAAEETAIDAPKVERGRELFHEVGCVACHGPFETPQAAYAEPAFPNVLPTSPPPVPFGDLSGKWRVAELAKFLRDPKAVRTHGRMPDFGLSEPDADAIAHYLAVKFGGAPKVEVAVAGSTAAVVAHAAPDAALVEAGKRIFNERGCAACHTLGDGIGFTPPAGMKALAALDAAHGCLADAATPLHGGDAPTYVLDAGQRADLAAAIESEKHVVTLPAPIETARRDFAAFRCGRCHEKDGAGGLSTELVPYFRARVEADLGDEGRLPPRLTGVGARLRSEWIEEVVGNGTRARPYLAAHMPKFGGDLAKSIANGFAAAEGEWRSDSDAARTGAAPVDLTLAVDGRRLAGKQGLNCITCHSFGDRPSAGTPGLDFLAFTQRLRGEFWRRYALNPMRFKPGTRMPRFFENGKSEIRDVLDGDATRQVDALWAWFQKSKEMPAPDGVPNGQRLVLDVGERDKVFRTFLEHAGSRGIAVGTPQGLHFAFDAEQIRLVEAWTGEFLDVAPVWTGRGGNPAPELGPVVWSAPTGPALLLVPADASSGSTVDPKFARAAEAWPADGGRSHGVKFRGYRLEADGSPTFLYELREPAIAFDAPPQPDGVEVEERFTPSTTPGVRFTRSFAVRGLKSPRLVMMREPADATGRVEVTHGHPLVAIRAKTEDDDKTRTRILFFASDGGAEPLTIEYGVKQ